MGFGPDGLGPPGLLRQLEARIGPEAPLQMQALMDQGLSARDAFAQLSQAAGFSPTPGQGQGPSAGLPQGPGFDAGPPGRLEPATVGQIFESLPPDVQQAIVRGADQLPQPVRDALDQLGITQPQVQPQGRGEGPQGSQAWGGTDGAASSRAGGSEPIPASGREALVFARADPAVVPAGAARAQSADAVPMAANAAVVREGGQPSAQAGQQVAPGMPAERTAQQGLATPAGGRAAEGFAGAARDPGTVVAMPERLANLQQATQGPNASALAARADALPLQTMAALAGASVLANPQPAPVPGHVGLAVPAPPGTDAAAAQARDSQLAPAGHTLAGFLRRDQRRGGAAHDRRPENWALALLAGARKRRVDDAEEQMASFQWLFWVLTIVAYGAIGLALVVMAAGGARLTSAYGTPSTAGYALIVGALAALASWFVGKRLAGKPG